MAYIARLTYYDLQAEQERVRLFGLTRRAVFVTQASDTPAHTVADPRIMSPALVRRDIFDVGTTGGASRTGYGDLELANADGELDWLLDVATDGRALDIFDSADNESAAFPAAFAQIISAVIEQIEVTQRSVRIRLRDRQAFTTRFVQETRFGGTNVLPNGLDGITSDLKAKPLPVLYGYAFNVSPPCVNTSRQIYRANDGAVRDVLAVYDSGALLTRETPDYADEAELQTVQPLPGHFRVLPSSGFFRLRSVPIGEVTCDAVEGDWPVNRTAAQIFKRVLEDRANIDPARISASDIAALDAAQPATVGVYFDTDVTVAAALDLLTRSVGAWWAVDADGTVRVRRLEAPALPATLTFNADNIEKGSLSRVPTNDDGLPAYRVTVRAVPNYTIQTSGLVGSVSASRRARLAQPFQDAVAENSATRAVHLLAPERVVVTSLVCLPAAQVEATRQLTIYGVRRDRFEFTARLSASELRSAELGTTVLLQYDRYNLSAGRLLRVLGCQINSANQSATFTVWG